MSIIHALQQAMFAFDQGDPRRVHHFVKVHSFAKWIGESEGLDKETLFILESAALTHDIGILPAERQYGHCNGKMQEEIGPAHAREMLSALGIAENVIERVCYLIAHHHTYQNVEGLDYRILLEADFLVNLMEDEASLQSIVHAYETIFQTKAGRMLCQTMFGL